jgi:putative transcription factor
MECEVCGRQIYGRQHRVVIDGARLVTCTGCAKYATATWQHRDDPKREVPRRKARGRPPQRVPAPLVREDLVLVEDFGNRIRKGRERLRFSHEELSREIGERVSILQKLEVGKMIPELSLTRKLERALKITLLHNVAAVDYGSAPLTKQKPSELTLGDVVVMRGARKAEEDKRAP